jgi:hypothetical protein
MLANRRCPRLLEDHVDGGRHNLEGPIRQRAHHPVVQRTTLVVLVMGSGLMLTRLAIGVRRGESAGYAQGSILVQLINVDQGDDAPDLRDEE